MIKDVKSFVKRYAAFDEPIPFKGLLIYPILLKQYYDFKVSYDILCIEKDKIPNPKIISMKYLDFIFSVVALDTNFVDEKHDFTKGKYNIEKLILILCLSLHVVADDIRIIMSNGHYKLIINSIEINSDDFDDFRRIILYQNLIDYNEEFVNPEVKEAMNEYYRSKNKGIVMPTLEDKMSVISAVNGLSKKDFIEMTIREFDMIFEKCVDLVDYKIYKTAESSGNVKFETPIEHWVYHKPTDLYAKVFSSYDTFKKEFDKQ